LSKNPNRKNVATESPRGADKKNKINNENTKYKHPLRVTVLGACLNVLI